MGFRETVGVALFAAALAITASLTFVGQGRSHEGPPPTISLGVPVPTATATEVPTPTPVPPAALDLSGVSWLVTFWSDGVDGSRRQESQGFVEGLDFAFDGAPFPDMRDDAWGLTAETTLTLDPGEYAFELEHDGTAAVSVNGEQVAAGPGAPGLRTLAVRFAHGGGAATILVEATDTGGRFELRVR
ncbi:MAG: hypothetical protein Kow0010_11820 [Dehalococcoidia bacterium]